MKPGEILTAIEIPKPLPAFVGPFNNVLNAATLDGSTYGLKPDLDEATWRALIGPNDGIVNPPLKSIKARFPIDSEEDKKALAGIVAENQALIAKLEEQLADHAALLKLSNKLTKDMDRAEEDRERIRKILDSLKAMNKKMRDEFGLREGSRPQQ